uniref:Galactosylgalactosylxylosylprotein 3-beta-glucuronosyltransferase n=1 Tax=Macrostomum lignano TaxID=282301 RepID=A0A1I8FD08_9PLAT
GGRAKQQGVEQRRESPGLVEDAAESQQLCRVRRGVGLSRSSRNRQFPLDMAGFAINLQLLHERRQPNWPTRLKEDFRPSKATWAVMRSDSAINAIAAFYNNQAAQTNLQSVSRVSASAAGQFSSFCNGMYAAGRSPPQCLQAIIDSNSRSLNENLNKRSGRNNSSVVCTAKQRPLWQQFTCDIAALLGALNLTGGSGAKKVANWKSALPLLHLSIWIQRSQ